MPAHLELRQSYVSAVRSLLTPPGAPADRGGVGPASPEEIEARAREVLGLSNELASVERDRLKAADPKERALAAQHLLAKAATELQIGAYLREAGDDEAARAPPSRQSLTERSGGTRANVSEYLKIILADEPATPPSVSRAGAEIINKKQLTESAGGACDLIAKRAGETAKNALDGLMGVGLAEIGQAAGAVASVVAGSLGADGVLSRLYALCRDFVKNVFDSVVSLIGDQLAKMIGDKAVEWIKDVKDQHLFADWLAKAYGVEAIKTDLGVAIDKSQAEPSRFSAAEADLDQLTDRFDRDMNLTDKLIGGLGWLRWLPGASGPQGLLIRGAAYLLLIAWAVLDGGDYLDSRNLDLIKRVPGVPSVVATRI
jgi:hypothetical protein